MEMTSTCQEKVVRESGTRVFRIKMYDQRVGADFACCHGEKGRRSRLGEDGENWQVPSGNRYYVGGGFCLVPREDCKERSGLESGIFPVRYQKQVESDISFITRATAEQAKRPPCSKIASKKMPTLARR